VLRYWSNFSNFSSPHVLLSTHFFEVFEKRAHFFDSNEYKIDYLTFDYLSGVSDKPNSKVTSRREEEIVFLYTLKKGIANSSFALNLARKVGLPIKIIERAEKLMKIIKDEIVLNKNGTELNPERIRSLLETSESKEIYVKYFLFLY
jgi:DNA mismatch repair ATPase MutS